MTGSLCLRSRMSRLALNVGDCGPAVSRPAAVNGTGPPETNLVDRSDPEGVRRATAAADSSHGADRQAVLDRASSAQPVDTELLRGLAAGVPCTPRYPGSGRIGCDRGAERVGMRRRDSSLDTLVPAYLSWLACSCGTE